MKLIEHKKNSHSLALTLSESACLLQLSNQILREFRKSDFLNSTVSVHVDSCTCSHLLDLADHLSSLIDYQLHE